MLAILVQNVLQTVIPPGARMTFIVKHASLASMVISVTKTAQNTVYSTCVTEMVVVTVVLDMEAIHVKPAQRTVVTLAVMNILYAMNVIQVFMETTVIQPVL